MKPKLNQLLAYFGFIMTTVILVMLDYFAKPQSDDWGWIVFVREYGILGTYQNMRETFQMSPYMILVMFPIILLQKYIHYGLLLFVVQMSLPLTLVLLARRLCLQFIQYRISFVKGVVYATPAIILIYLTAWNSNTFQNAIFWLTGATGYILPISLFLLFLERILKTNKTFLDKTLLIGLSLFLVSFQINYIFIFGLIFLYLIKENVIKKDRFLLILISMGLVFLVYTWAYPGWLARTKSTDELTAGNALYHYFKTLLQPFVNEPIWVLCIITFFIYISWVVRKEERFRPNYKKIRTILFVFLILYILNNALIIIAFAGKSGYGRVYFLSHFLFMIVLFLTVFLLNVEKYLQRKIKPMLLFTLIFIMLLFFPLKVHLYKAYRFSNLCNKRHVFLANISKAPQLQECIYVDKLPKSGILGYVDLNENVKCGDFIGCLGPLTYPGIIHYDHWLHREYLNLREDIIINLNNKNETQ